MIRRHLSRCEGEAKPQCLDSNGGVSLFPSCNLSRQSYFILPQTRNSQDGGAGNSIPLVILSFRNLKVLSVHAHMGLLTPGRALQSTDNLVFLYYDQMHQVLYFCSRFTRSIPDEFIGLMQESKTRLKFKYRLRELTFCLRSTAALAVCLEGRLAGLNTTKTGN